MIVPARTVLWNGPMGIFEIAAEALRRNDLPDELRGPLAAESDETINLASFPYGCHVCEV